MGAPAKCVSGSCLAGSGSTSLVFLGDNTGLRTVVSNSPDAYGLGLREGRPLWGRAVHTSVYGAHLSSVPSGDRSVFPATLGASGHSDLQQINFSASVQKRSGPERFATSEKVFRTARSAIPCRSSASGHRASSSKHTRGQSRETGSLSTFYGSVETSAKCISMGFAQSRERVQDSVRVSSASVQRGISHSGGPRAGSGNGTSRYSYEEGDHRGQGSTAVTSSFRRRMGVASYSISEIIKPLSHETQVQDAYYQASRVSNQVRGLVCDNRSERRLLPYIHSSSTPKVPKGCFEGQIIPISVLSFGLALSHRTFTKCVDATLAPLRLQSIHILN